MLTRLLVIQALPRYDLLLRIYFALESTKCARIGRWDGRLQTSQSISLFIKGSVVREQSRTGVRKRLNYISSTEVD
jgi:hypothetical protein